ncbi:asparaginase [Candidatus Micrarchaeota archaeon]|nr:asparaginase [Candidatus Micrarchaeota archaeon]
MKIKIFVTGGTFDKEYDEIEQLLEFKKTHLPQVLEQARCKLEISVETVFLKDSRDTTDIDREKIAKACAEAKEDKIVITHGTDTADQTARALKKKVKNKTIVLTGAMVPYAFNSSDGSFNLGCALAFVQTLPPGVYVTMNGFAFDAENVKKNLKTGVFSELK